MKRSICLAVNHRRYHVLVYCILVTLTFIHVRDVCDYMYRIKRLAGYVIYVNLYMYLITGS
jgi:hypothetical protein